MKAGERLFTGRVVSEIDANKYNEMIDSLNDMEANCPELKQEIELERNRIHQFFISLCYKGLG